MSLKRTIPIVLMGWLSFITLLHGFLNLDWHKGWGINESHKLRIGYIPVTCHLTCPVTDFITKQTTGVSPFEPERFNGFAEIIENFDSGNLPITFILAPLAMSLREKGVPIKVVYLGHRDGTAMMVHKQSSIRRIEDLRGKKIAIPNRYANQRLLLYKVLRERGLSFSDVTIVEIPPPEMPAALYSKSVDAITAGEPFMAQTEMDGYGRVLYLTKDVWPNFISCVLAVHEDLIRTNRPAVQQLVDGIARSGKWVDQSIAHRLAAGGFVATNYYNQNPDLLRFVLTKPPDRVKYTSLKPMKKEFEEIQRLGVETGMLKGTATFEEYVDDSFVNDENAIEAWDYEPSSESGGSATKGARP